MGVLDAPAVPPVTPWLPSADGIDPTLHLDFVGQNFRTSKTERSLARALSTVGGYFARPSGASFYAPTGRLVSVAADVPHVAWSVPANAYRGLKIERRSANILATSSAQFGSTASPVYGPDGTLSLKRCIAATPGTYTQGANTTITANTGPYTISAIVAKTTTTQAARLAAISIGGGGFTAYVEADLVTGVIAGSTGSLAGVDDLGLFWLFWVSFTPSAGDNLIQPRFYPAGNAGSGSADIGFAQLEQGTAPTSRIATTGTAGVIRERDYLAVPAAGVLGANAGTLTVAATIPGGAIERVIAQVDDGTENNSIRIRRSTAGNIEAVWTVAGVAVQTMNLGAHTAGAITSITVGWGGGKLKAIRDGGTLTTATAAVPAGLSRVRLGGNTTASSLDGFVTAVSIWDNLRTEPFYPAPIASFVALGDSMAAGSGASTNGNQWNNLLAAATGRTWQQDGSPGQSSAYVLQQWQADTAHWSWTVIIFVGHNYTTTTDPAADIAAMIALMSVEPRLKRFLVVSPIQNANNPVGTAGYIAITALRAALKSAYPNNYVDLVNYLATKGNNSTQDNADIASGYTPTSLRADTIHLNDAGQVLEAALYQAELAKRGW